MSEKSQIQLLQEEIAEKQKQLNELRRSLPPEPIKDCELSSIEGDKTSLSAFFGEESLLLVIHNMGKSCNYCTLWADGFSGIHEHLQNRLPYIFVSPDDPSVLKEFAASRNWKMPLYSSAGTAFKKESGFENAGGGALPGVAVLQMKDGQIQQVAKDSFGPGDNYCSIWHLFDLLPEGAKDWRPQLSYS